MKTYTVYCSNRSDLTIAGETLADAVTANLKAICKAHNVGNAAGYNLTRARLEFSGENTTSGGKPFVRLILDDAGHKLAHREGTPKQYVITIENCTREDCPEPVELIAQHGGAREGAGRPASDPSGPMKEIKVMLPPHALAKVDARAAAGGVSRSEVVRQAVAAF